MPREIKIAAIILVSIFSIGTLGYMLIEDWGFLDALFMTVISLTTVGYQEVKTLTTAGRIFTIFLLLSGAGVLVYSVSMLLSFMLEGELGSLMRRRKMEKQIGSLKDHYIICAGDEIGEYVIEEFIETEQPFVLVTSEKNLIDKFRENTLYVEGNPTEDEFLIKAGIKNAKGLISVLNEDKDNLFVVLSARQINHGIRIVSQAVDKDSVTKIKKAGADEVISTNFIAAMRMASAMIRPAVVTFLDTMLRQTGEPLRVEEAIIAHSSPLVNKTLRTSKIAEETGLMVVAIKDATNGSFVYNPKSDYVFHGDDTLIVIGNPKQVHKLNGLIAGNNC